MADVNKDVNNKDIGAIVSGEPKEVKTGVRPKTDYVTVQGCLCAALERRGGENLGCDGPRDRMVVIDGQEYIKGNSGSGFSRPALIPCGADSERIIYNKD